MNEEPVPPFFSETPDGTTQLRRHWKSPAPKASVLLVHGIGEHTGRYEHVGRFFAERGYDLLAADNRGFGQSGGDRAHVESFDEFLDDLEALMTERRAEGRPVILFGHSLGGLICATYLVSGRPQPDYVVLSSPALAAEVPTWQRVAAPIMAKVKPTLFIASEIDGELLSRDPAVGEKYAADPLLVKGATAGLGSAIFGAMKATSANLHRIKVPTYVLHGAEDKLVPPSASESLGKLANVTRRLWPNLRHECLNEPEQVEVMTEIVGWLDTQLDGD